MLGGEEGRVKYNIMRNVVKFKWATELIIFTEGVIHMRKDVKFHSTDLV